MRYKLKDKEKPEVKKEILQRIKAKTAEINRYQQRVFKFKQNRVFRNNWGWFYKQIDGREEGEKVAIPDAKETKTFWTDIWVQEVEHNKDAAWFREINMMNGKKNRHEHRFHSRGWRKCYRTDVFYQKSRKDAEGSQRVLGTSYT